MHLNSQLECRDRSTFGIRSDIFQHGSALRAESQRSYRHVNLLKTLFTLAALFPLQFCRTLFPRSLSLLLSFLPFYFFFLFGFKLPRNGAQYSWLYRRRVVINPLARSVRKRKSRTAKMLRIVPDPFPASYGCLFFFRRLLRSLLIFTEYIGTHFELHPRHILISLKFIFEKLEIVFQRRFYNDRMTINCKLILGFKRCNFSSIVFPRCYSRSLIISRNRVDRESSPLLRYTRTTVSLLWLGSITRKKLGNTGCVHSTICGCTNSTKFIEFRCTTIIMRLCSF